MKTIIVYFSLEGNTKYAAEKIAEGLGADLLALEPVMPYPKNGVSKFLIGGMKASLHDAPALKAYTADLSQYECVIFGTPVWASTFAPPLRSFIKKNNLSGKKLAFFACSKSGNAGKPFQDLAKELRANYIIAELSLIDPFLKKKDGDLEKIKMFCSKIQEA